MIFKAPPLDDAEDKTFKEGDKCYQYKKKKTKCKPGVELLRYKHNLVAINLLCYVF